MKLKFGIQIEPQFGFDYSTVESIALTAENLGYYSLWSSDHFFLHDKSEKLNCMESWTLLSALAAKTTRIRLGALVTGNSYRYPAVLAKIASTVDMISSGRLEFGIGAGWKEIEYKAYGIPFPPLKERMDRLEESIQIIRMLWTEAKASFSGKYYQINDAFSAPKPVQKLPPIFVGGAGPSRTLKIVAKYADYCNFGWFTPYEKIPELLQRLRAHCESVGRAYKTVGKSFFAYVIMEDDQEVLTRFLDSEAKRRGIELDDYKKRLTGAFIGSSEEVINKFEDLISLGFDYFQVMFPYGRDLEKTKDFARLVMPKITSAVY